MTRRSQSNTRSPTILVDEPDAGLFERPPYCCERRPSRFAGSSFELMHGYNSNARRLSKILLTPRKKPAASPRLLGCDHPFQMPDSLCFYNSIENLLTSESIKYICLYIYFMQWSARCKFPSTVSQTANRLSAVPTPGLSWGRTSSVTAAVAELPLPQRVVIVLHHFEGRSYAEVAAITHSSVPAVRSHLFRARRTLTTALAEWR